MLKVGVTLKAFRIRVIFLLCIWLVVFCGVPWVAQAQSQLESLSSSIRETLSLLKAQSNDLQSELTNTIVQLQTRSQDLKMSEQERTRLEELSTNLQSSLNSMTKKYEALYSVSEQYKYKLRTTIKFCVALVVILVLRIIAMCAGYILYAQGVKLPRWVDILL